MRIGEYREKLFLEEIALTVRHRRIELELGAVRGYRELERVIVGLARVRLFDREKTGIELLHTGYKLFQSLISGVWSLASRARQGYLVERHVERLEAWRLLCICVRRHKPRRDIAHEVAMEVIGDMWVIKLFHHRERILDPLLFHRLLELLHRLFAPA